MGDVAIKAKLIKIYFEDDDETLSTLLVPYKRYLTKKDAIAYLEAYEPQFQQYFKNEVVDVELNLPIKELENFVKE